jgi:hypothetical protein
VSERAGRHLLHFLEPKDKAVGFSFRDEIEDDYSLRLKKKKTCDRRVQIMFHKTCNAEL